jgi:hypothetical protein
VFSSRGTKGPRDTAVILRGCFPVSAVEQGGEPSGCFPPHAGVHVLVHGERDGRAGVPEPFGDDLDRFAGGARTGGGRAGRVVASPQNVDGAFLRHVPDQHRSALVVVPITLRTSGRADRSAAAQRARPRVDDLDLMPSESAGGSGGHEQPGRHCRPETGQLHRCSRRSRLCHGRPAPPTAH